MLRPSIRRIEGRPGVGRADVWVFDADHLGSSLEGDPTTIVTLFADTPRALAVNSDGRRVYAAAFHSGNRTAGLESAFITPDGPSAPDGDYSHQGDQIRGFGFLHNGGVDTIARFMSAIGFSDLIPTGGFPFDASGDPLRHDVEAFLLAFDSNMAPVVGQQVTLDSASGGDRHGRVDLLMARAAASPAECELVASARFFGQERSWLYLVDSGRFVPNEHGAPSLADPVLRLAALVRPVTCTCVPVGSGQRIGLDADLDGCYDLTEIQAGFDARDPASTPPGCG